MGNIHTMPAKQLRNERECTHMERCPFLYSLEFHSRMSTIYIFANNSKHTDVDVIIYVDVSEGGVFTEERLDDSQCQQ